MEPFLYIIVLGGPVNESNSKQETNTTVQDIYQ